MTRRLLPAALLTAAFALLPGTAYAAPADPAPAAAPATTWTSWYATADVPLTDGRTASVTLSRYRATLHDEWQGSLSVWLKSACTGWSCPASPSGYVTLDGDEVQFDRGLADASVTDVPVTLSTWAWAPTGGYTRTDSQVTVSAVFTGTGQLQRDTYHGDRCGAGDPCPNSLRRDVSRAATVAVTVDDVSGAGAGTMSAGWALDVAPTAPGTAR